MIKLTDKIHGSLTFDRNINEILDINAVLPTKGWQTN
tara:strand:+ start:8311 stop:8421 length:111 start_codon:yes stop_codon:yes gene_type:complete